MPKQSNEDAIKIQRIMLEISGAWPHEKSSAWYHTKGVVNYWLSVCLTITMFMEVYSVRNDFAKLSEILYILLSMLSYNLKHANLFLNRKTFRKAIALLNSEIFYIYPDDLNKYMKIKINRLQLLANGYKNLVCATFLLMCVLPFYNKQPLPFPFPYDTGNYRIPMYIFQVYALGVVSWNHLTYDSLCACLTGTAAIQLTMLEAKIVRLMSENVGSNRTRFEARVIANLKHCIVHHDTIIQYVKLLDEIFCFGVLMQFLASIIIICNTLFHAVLIPIGSPQFFMLSSYLCVVMLELFMYCWYANDVVWKSIQIGEACYTSNWEDCSGDVSKYLIFIMERSKQPLTITAFKFAPVSLKAFTSVLQWSYSYFALLMKLYKKQSGTGSTKH